MLGPRGNPYLKVAFVVLCILIFFLFVFKRSKTLELRYDKYFHNGMPYTKTVYIYHWDRFSKYLTEIPDKIKSYFENK